MRRRASRSGLSSTATASFHDARRAAGVRSDRSSRSSATVLKTGTPVMIPDVRAHPDWSLPTDLTAEVSWMGIPLFRTCRRGRVALAVQARARLLQRRAHEAGRSTVVPGLGGRRERHSLRADAGIGRCDAIAARRLVEAQESERRHIAGNSTTRRARPWCRCASDFACWRDRSTRAAT